MIHQGDRVIEDMQRGGTSHLDLLSFLEVDPGGHVSSELHKALLPRCDVQLHRQTTSAEMLTHSTF